MYQVVKTYGPDVGLSAVFRQWRATHSHCSHLHGYAIAVRLLFEAETLDERNWVIDFGALKPIKEWLQSMFDHKTLVAADDPHLDDIAYLSGLGVLDYIMVPAVGCEAFAKMIHDHITEWMFAEVHTPRVRLAEVEVREHGANAAVYRPTSTPITEAVRILGDNEDVGF